MVFLGAVPDQQCGSDAAGASLLDRRAGHVCIGTVDAAIARHWLQKNPAALAIIEPLAGIRRHGFSFTMPAFWTGNDGIWNYWFVFFFHKAYTVIATKINNIGKST